jgi:hypothetical protein
MEFKAHFEKINTMPELKGLRYNKGKLRWSLVDYKALEPMIRVLMYGAEKYTTQEASGDHNWKKGLDKIEILECLQRHLAALMDGELYDKESGLPHIGHIMCNAMFYSHFMEDEKVPHHIPRQQEKITS